MGSAKDSNVKVCALTSNTADRLWPDFLDIEAGVFHYYGDNRKPGQQVEATPKYGNKFLSDIFRWCHGLERGAVPPIFVFTSTGSGYDVMFRGLVAPGSSQLSQSEDLIAVWKSVDKKRFQNYRAIFTVLDVPVITRDWINDIQSGKADCSIHAPQAWADWKKSGAIKPLFARRAVSIRTPHEQTALDELGSQLISTIHQHFRDHEDGAFAFERCASEIVRMMDRNVVSIENTRPWRDGGRDATGVYRIGVPGSYVDVEFAVEAKCYGLNNGCGVALTSRLISRLRHRQFGIFVTTSYLATQAYKELVEDGHPVLVIAATDIAKIVIDRDITTVSQLKDWLERF
jgi:hypothetical protein